MKALIETQMTSNSLFTVHPSCLNYPEDLTDQIYAQPWQCINCKTCFICNKAGDDVSTRSLLTLLQLSYI